MGFNIFSFCTKSFKYGVYFRLTTHLRFRLVIFQGLNCHLCLETTILDGADLDF